jgi:hypothetical protein
MKTVIDISIDSETWGTRATYDARSLGACVFNPYTGSVGTDAPSGIEPRNSPMTFYTALDNPLQGSYSQDHFTQKDLDLIGGGHRRYHLYRDPKTVDFWHAPEQAAAAEAFDNPVDLKKGLIAFSTWLTDVYHRETNFKFANVNPLSKDFRFWSHGKAFDPPIIEAWYHAVGLPVPWFYRAPRDSRTAFDMIGIDDHSGFMKMHSVGIPHNALDDSVSLARALCTAFSMRSTWKG